MNFSIAHGAPRCICTVKCLTEPYISKPFNYNIEFVFIDFISVSENVLWDSVTVGVYTEDGNEMNNTISKNVMICHNIHLCKFGNNENNWQPESGVKEGGLFFFGMTNYVSENRVAGHEHGFWSPGGSIWQGKGEASGKMCPQYAPFLQGLEMKIRINPFIINSVKCE